MHQSDRLGRLLGMELTEMMMFTGFIGKLSDLLVLFNGVAGWFSQSTGGALQIFYKIIINKESYKLNIHRMIPLKQIIIRYIILKNTLPIKVCNYYFSRKYLRKHTLAF